MTSYEAEENGSRAGAETARLQIDYLMPRNWSSFQHYKHRRPPWIKLHRELLDNRAFNTLPMASRALAPFLWLLASEHPAGVFNSDPAEISYRLRWDTNDVIAGLAPLISAGFFVRVLHDSVPLAERIHGAIPETKTEEEEEPEAKKRTKLNSGVFKQAPFQIPDWVPAAQWQAFVEMRSESRHALTEHAAGLVVAKLAGLHGLGQDIGAVLDQSTRNGWRDVYAVKHDGAGGGGQRHRPSFGSTMIAAAQERHQRRLAKAVMGELEAQG